MVLEDKKILAIGEKLTKNAEKLEVAKAKVKALETERQKLEHDKDMAFAESYLPVIQQLNLSPQELLEFFADKQ